MKFLDNSVSKHITAESFRSILRTDSTLSEERVEEMTKKMEKDGVVDVEEYFNLRDSGHIVNEDLRTRVFLRWNIKLQYIFCVVFLEENQFLLRK